MCETPPDLTNSNKACNCPVSCSRQLTAQIDAVLRYAVSWWYICSLTSIDVNIGLLDPSYSSTDGSIVFPVPSTKAHGSAGQS